MADLDGFEEQYGLNSRLVKDGGRLVEEVWRLNGRYRRRSRPSCGHLQAALPVAPPAMRRALEALIRFYETGDDADRVTYDIAWVEDKDSPVDTINGFIENYLDARGVKGAWEALVFYVNSEKTESLHRLAEAAAWFEVRMPWDPKWRRSDVVGVTARAIDVVVETGEVGSDDGDRDQPAERSADPRNRTAASPCRSPTSTRRTTSRSCRPTGASSAGRRRKSSARRSGARVASEVTTAIHEVLGHGSGRVAEHLDGQPQLALKEQYSAIEEARADLVALYFVTGAADRRDRHAAGGASGRDRVRPSTKATRAMRSCSSGGCARARRSKKITCATAR